MLNGRQATLDAALRFARARLHSQLTVEPGRALAAASRLIALAWFAFGAAVRDQLGRIDLPHMLEAGSAMLLPAVALLTAGWKLRQLRLQAIVDAFPALPHHVAPGTLYQRLTLCIADASSRCETVLNALQVRFMRDVASLMRSVRLDARPLAALLESLAPRPFALAFEAQGPATAQRRPDSPARSPLAFALNLRC